MQHILRDKAPPPIAHSRATPGRPSCILAGETREVVAAQVLREGRRVSEVPEAVRAVHLHRYPPGVVVTRGIVAAILGVAIALIVRAYA